MNHHDRDQLLNEILAGEEVAEFRRASLDRTLAALRRKRRQRAWTAGALALAPVMLATVLWLGRAAKPLPEVALAPDAGRQPKTAAIRYLTDDELFALYPGRPLALIGPPGQQRLVFLDQPARRVPRL